jgi:hypothetical protein
MDPDVLELNVMGEAKAVPNSIQTAQLVQECSLHVALRLRLLRHIRTRDKDVLRIEF